MSGVEGAENYRGDGTPGKLGSSIPGALLNYLTSFFWKWISLLLFSLWMLVLQLSFLPP
jgi:hypothetical protein